MKFQYVSNIYIFFFDRKRRKEKYSYLLTDVLSVYGNHLKILDAPSLIKLVDLLGQEIGVNKLNLYIFKW